MSSISSERCLLSGEDINGNIIQISPLRTKKRLSSCISKYVSEFRRIFRQCVTGSKIIGVPSNELNKILGRSNGYSVIEDNPVVVINRQAHDICWSQCHEIGYKYETQDVRVPIHEELEDILKITVNDFNTVTKQVLSENSDIPRMQIYTRSSLGSSNNSKMFLFTLADGHGGCEAAKYFVSRTHESISLLVESRKWDLTSQREKNLFKKEVIKIFTSLDSMFIEKKIKEYKAWQEHQKSFKDDAIDSIEKKPKDDGCTLVVNLIFQNYLINVNTGDSRTIVASKPGFDKPLRCIFVSKDHNMTHKEKVKHAHENGGKFVSREGLVTTVYPTNITAPFDNDNVFRNGLKLRLYRPPTKFVKELSLSCNRTLNLSAAMGDLLFKVNPCVVSCLPDVSFISLEPELEYLVIAATDGVWDYIDITRNSKFKNLDSIKELHNSDAYYEAHADLILKLSDALFYGKCRCNANTNTNCVNTQQLSSLPAIQSDKNGQNFIVSVSRDKSESLDRLASVLVTREPEASLCKCTEGFFYKNLSRYDDSTCIAVYLRSKCAPLMGKVQTE